jgi:hypothetical protein
VRNQRLVDMLISELSKSDDDKFRGGIIPYTRPSHKRIEARLKWGLVLCSEFLQTPGLYDEALLYARHSCKLLH